MDQSGSRTGRTPSDENAGREPVFRSRYVQRAFRLSAFPEGINEKLSSYWYQGVQRCCLRSIHAKLTRKGVTQKHIADQLQVSEVAVSGWFSDTPEIKNRHFIALHTEFKRFLRGVFPPEKERAIDGYIQAMWRFRKDEQLVANCERPGRMDFESLYVMCQSEAWEKADRINKNDALVSAAEAVINDVHKALHKAKRSNLFDLNRAYQRGGRVGYLRHLDQEWVPSYVTVMLNLGRKDRF